MTGCHGSGRVWLRDFSPTHDTAFGDVEGCVHVGNDPAGWLGNALDAHKRSQVMFIQREDILNLYAVTNLPLPEGGALPPASTDPWAGVNDEPPF